MEKDELIKMMDEVAKKRQEAEEEYLKKYGNDMLDYVNDIEDGKSLLI